MTTTTILSDNGASSGSAGIKTTGGNDGTLALQTTTSGGTATNAVYIDNTQQVGIGTSSPSGLLNLGGQATSTLRIDATGANGTRAVISTTNSAVYFNYDYGSSGVPIIFAGGGVAAAGTEKMRINAGAPILCLAGGNTSATGTGIAFPASQSASSDANTLDDYEEGTFNVAVAFSGASVGVTYNNNTFSYTKIGNMVHVRGYLYLSNKGSSTGTVTITGLPFNVKNSTPNYVPASYWFTSMTYSGAVTSYVVPGNAYIILGQTTTGGTFSQLTNSNFTNTTEIMVSLSYAAE